MRSYGPRFDPETGAMHARVHQATDYNRTTLLRQRKIGNGTLKFMLVRSSTPGARRYVQLHAEYEDAGVAEYVIVQCENELDEARQHARLERIMLAASARPTGANSDASAQDPAAAAI
jgi:hypothetical protein